MSETICSQEMAVGMAARTGTWSIGLQAHLAGCAQCREISETVQAMQALATPGVGDAPLPEAARLWALALLEQKQAEAARARRSLAAVELGTAALIAAGAAGWLAWNWPALELQFSTWRRGAWRQLWQATWWLAEGAPPLASAPIPLVLLALLAAVAWLVAQPLFQEE